MLRSQLDAREASDPNLHTILGRLETPVDRQEERIQTLEGQLDWVQNRQALCPCIRSRTLMSVHEGLEEEASEGSREEVPVSSTSCLVSMTAVGSFRWGSEAGTAVGEAWGQELDEEDGEEDECQGAVFMAAKFEVFPTLSLKTFTHFTFPLRTYQTNPLSLPPFSFILRTKTSTMGEHQWITDLF